MVTSDVCWHHKLQFWTQKLLWKVPNVRHHFFSLLIHYNSRLIPKLRHLFDFTNYMWLFQEKAISRKCVAWFTHQLEWPKHCLLHWLFNLFTNDKTKSHMYFCIFFFLKPTIAPCKFKTLFLVKNCHVFFNYSVTVFSPSHLYLHVLTLNSTERSRPVESCL